MNVVIRFESFNNLWYAHVRQGDSWKRYMCPSAYKEGCIAQLETCGYASW